MSSWLELLIFLSHFLKIEGMQRGGEKSLSCFFIIGKSLAMSGIIIP